MRLRRSIKSCSFVVLTDAGGSGKANALHRVEVKVVGTYEVVPEVSLIGAITSLVPADGLRDDVDCALECLHSEQNVNQSRTEHI